MPPLDESASQKASIQSVCDAVGIFPMEAYDFLQRGLAHTVSKIYGVSSDPDGSRHVSGAQLCEGLREIALVEWGLMAPMVLRRWNISSTYDFGQMVFALIDAGLMQKTDDDTIEDFRDVYDFKTAFEPKGYRIECQI